MKSLSQILIVALCSAWIPALSAAPKVGGDPVSNPLTNDELVARQKVVNDAVEERKAQLKPGDTVKLKREKREKRGDIVSRSTVLTYGKNWTIVPKGAVLYAPSYLTNRVDGDKAKRFVAWPEFYKNNRGWIHLQNVKMRQARGKEEFPEGAVDSYPKIGRVVVAVCHGGPISVITKTDEEEGEGGEVAGDSATAQVRQ